MKHIYTLFCLSFLMLIGSGSFAQSTPEYVAGEVLVQTGPRQEINKIVGLHATYNGIPTGLKIKQHVSKHMRVWLLEFDAASIDHERFLSAIQNNPYVRIAQNNHIIKNRLTTPNDTQYANQWQYDNNGSNGGVVDADIDADEAWDITTGGITALGDTIVACVIDDGLDLNHLDFGDNLWVNHAEIPNDNIDNDGNGYIDDYLGWDADNNNDNISGGGHGTPVAGIVGAKGNNNLGVSGVNWNVKLMIVQGGGNEAQAIAAYAYPLEMRKMYNQSNGAEGAFVVSTNASWGINNGQPANAPLWCAMYDTLGVYGILSAGATANANFNIDVVGDLPTACPSDFLISVTNCDRSDNKVNQAGYGVTTIDIGAHGQDTWTTAAGNSYGGFGGTSGATPHVTGAIALLYSAPCPSFITLAKSFPDSAARLAKQYIMDGGDPNSSLAGITVSGNRLNLKGALDLLLADCDTSVCAAPFALSTNNIMQTSSDLEWLALPAANSFVVDWREIGAPTWNTTTATSSPFNLTGLTGCTDYEFRVSADCGVNGTSVSSSIQTFKTDGCCVAPANLTASNVGNFTADVDWNAVTAAFSYDIRYKETASATWMDITGLTTTSTSLSGLMECAEYEVQIKTVCDTGGTAYTPSVLFNTLGCGACIDETYCASGGGSSEEWLEEFVLDTYTNTSGNNNGYGDFTGTPIPINPTMTYNLAMTPEFSSQSFDEYFMVWIDYNQDGDFDDADETVFDAGFATDVTVNGSFTVPANATAGITRLRVSMQYDAAAGNCDANFQYGEVEDYCVLIADSVIGIPEQETLLLSLFPNPANNELTVLTNGSRADLTLEIVDAAGRLIQTEKLNATQSKVNTSNLNSGVYFVRLTANNKVRITARLLIQH